MKKIFYIFIVYISSFQSLLAADAKSREELKAGLIPDSANNVLSGGIAGEEGEGMLDSLLDFARDSIFGLMALVAIGMFLYIGARLVVARGNPEEFKKALTSFVYAAVGIFTVAAALAIVRFIAGINL